MTKVFMSEYYLKFNPKTNALIGVTKSLKTICRGTDKPKCFNLGACANYALIRVVAKTEAIALRHYLENPMR